MKTILSILFSIIFCFGLCGYGYGQDQELDERLKNLRPELRAEYLKLLEKHKSKAANSQKIERRIKEHVYLFHLNIFFKPVVVPVKKFSLRTDDRVYSLLKEESILDEFGFGAILHKEMLNRSDEMAERWHKEYDKFLTDGNIEHIELFETELKSYQEQIESNFSTSQLDKLDAIKLWAQMLRDGIRAHVRSGSIEFKSTRDEDRFLSRMKDVAKETRSKGNRLFVKQIEKLLPGYLDSMLETDADRLPLLPLNKFLAICENSEPGERQAKRCFSKYDVDPLSGNWLFLGPVFRINPHGTTETVGLRSNFSWQPTTPMRIIERQVAIRLTDDQKDEYARNLLKLTSPGLGNPRNATQEGKKLGFINEGKEINKWWNEELDPIQTRSIKNYGKIHLLFTVGPSFVQNRLGDISKEDFDTQLDQMKAVLRKHIDSSERTFAEAFAKEYKEITGNSISRRIIDSPKSSNYERLLIPLL